jgi:DNA-binding PucR family transcriptional regulator
VESDPRGAASAEAGRAWERVVRPLAAEVAARAHELSVEVVDRIRPQLPVLFPDPEAVEANRASTEASIRAVAELIERGADPKAIELPPETLAYARDGARRGIPLTALMRSYRLGHAALWEIVARDLAARAEDRDELAEATDVCSALMFAYVDHALTLADEEYAAERERFARSAAASRAHTIEAILTGQQLDAAAAGRRLRYELDRRHVGIVAWLESAPEDADPHTLLEGAVGVVAEATRATPALVHPIGLLASAGWVSVGPTTDLAPVAELRLDPTMMPWVRLAVGDPAEGVAGFRASHEQAAQARRVATLANRPAGSVTRYARVALQAMATADLDQARSFVDRQLGRLAVDDDTARRLVATLRVYLDEHASRGRAAKRLGVHENTISYRIRQIEEILGRSVEEDTLDLRVALALMSTVRPSRIAPR